MTNSMLDQTFQDMKKIFGAERSDSSRGLYKLEQSEHCPDCGAHTGDGRRCGFCEDLRQKELKSE